MTTKNKMIESVKKNIGKQALWTAKNGLKFFVQIIDAQIHYGVAHYIVKPVAGDGRARVRDYLVITK